MVWSNIVRKMLLLQKNKMNTIVDNLQTIKAQLYENVQLIAVSKLKSEEEIMQAYQAGQRLFGENYVQELSQKYTNLPKDILWHHIGHLQSNKIKYIIPFVACIQGIDSEKLLQEVNKQAAKHKRIVDVLLQFHIAQEETKFGFDMQEAISMLENENFKNLTSVRICGVMGMATFTDNKEMVRKEFRLLKNYFDMLKEKYFAQNEYFSQISMGMTDDFDVAMQEGSTMVRIGSAIFGKRIYKNL